MKVRLLAWLTVMSLAMGWSQIAHCQESARLTAPQLFPAKSLAYVRVDDVTKMKQDIEKMWVGKLSNDADLKPILMEFYSTIVNVTQQIENSVGLNLDELLSIPRGEFAIAFIGSDQPSGRSSRRKNAEKNAEEDPLQLRSPAVAFLLDAGDEIASVQILLNRLQESMPAEMQHTEKMVDRLTIHRYENETSRQQKFGYFIDKGVMVAVSDPDYIEKLALVWLGQVPDWESLADNRRFTSILAQCVGTQGERPQISFYADPMGLFRQFNSQSAAGTAALAMIPALGFDGIQGVGGSSILAPPDFDAISHFHIQLASPRKSVLGLLRPKAGSTTPENWVPENVATYVTINWDFVSTAKAVEQLYNQFRGPEAFQNEVIAPASERLAVDFRKDILEMFEGRITRLEGFVRPITINSGSFVVGIRIKNMQYFKDNVYPKLMEVVESRNAVASESLGSFSFRAIDVPGRRNNDTPMRTPEICFALLDDYLIISDSRYMIKQVADCVNGTIPKLNASLDYQLIAERIELQLQKKECSAISYGRSEESLQMFYELARDPKNRDRLKQVADTNGFMKALLAALEKKDLPPFSVIAKYLAPSGGFLVDDETGLHLMSFDLRRE